MSWKVSILTVSDKCSRGDRQDLSANVIREQIETCLNGFIACYRIVPDEAEEIKKLMIYMSDQINSDLIITTGGTGLSYRDVTPEATKQVIEREVPGIAEAMRSYSMKITHSAMLSRAVCGIRNQTLIINLPGSPKGAKENLDAVIHQLPHALGILTGREGEHRSFL